MNPRLKELFSNTLIFTIANFSSKILVFLMVPLYTAVLTTEEYGISDMVSTISGLMYPVLSLAISSAVLRFCFIKEYSHEDVFTVGHRVVCYGTLISVALTAILYFSNAFPQLGFYIWFVPPQFFFHCYASFLSHYARGVGEVKISAVAGVSSTFATISLNLLFLLVFRWGILGYMLSYLSGSLTSAVVLWFKLKGRKQILPSVNKDLRNQMVKFSAPLIPNDLSWWALHSFNRFLIISMLGVSAVGIYSASAKIPAILTAVFGIFTQAWMLSALNGYGDKENTRFIRNVHKKLFCLLAFITALFILATKPLAQILLSGEFSSCWMMIPYLMISVIMGAMVGFYGSIYSAERKNTMQFVSTLGGAAVSVLIMVFLLKEYGIIIASISNMVGNILIWLIRKEGIKKFIDIGMSTFACVVQVALLIIESVFVSMSLWLPATIVFVVIVIVNGKELVSSVKYFWTLFVGQLIKKRKG